MSTGLEIFLYWLSAGLFISLCNYIFHKAYPYNEGDELNNQ